MRCSNCGKEVQASGALCPLCGSLLSSAQAGVAASPAKRLAAFILDGIIWTIIYVAGTAFLFGGAAADSGGGMLLGLLIILGSFVLLLFTWAKSTSPGKWLLGMKVYRISGKPLGFFMMLVRETIGKFISGLVLSLGYLWLLWDRDKQAWHDKLVGSVVLTRHALPVSQTREAVTK